VVYLLATACALSNALASVLQRMGIEDAPVSDTLKLRLLTHGLKRGVWLLGLAFVVATVPLQIVALHLGNLSQVQPILTAELLFLVILLATWFRFRVGWREWFGCAAAAGGLAGFLVFAQPGGGTDVPTTFEWVVAGSLCGGAALLATFSALRGPRWWRAAAFGVAAAVGFAFTASLIKTVSNYIASDWVHMFFHWQTYGGAVCGALSLFLTQNAFHAGPIAASQTSLVLVDPLVSIALGIGLYGDSLRTNGAYGPLEAISLLIMFVGATSIALSPLVSGMKGDDDRYAEMLSLRSHSKRLIDAVQQDLPPE
jgi:drug/metabolite transporter (DMT)-like permease